jgi:hypothetical protein
MRARCCRHGYVGIWEKISDSEKRISGLGKEDLGLGKEDLGLGDLWATIVFSFS